MKKSILLLLCGMVFSIAQAQDVIVLKNANEIEAKVSAISPDAVTYKRWSNIDGPTYTIPKSDILYIKYQNGEKEIIQVQASKVVSTPTVVRQEYVQPKKIKQPKINKSETRPTIRYRGEVNLGYAIADKTPYLFSEAFVSENYKGEELGNGYGSSSRDTLHTNLSRPLFETVHGVEIGKYLFVGAGIGLQYFNGKLQDLSGWAPDVEYANNYKWNTLLLPIFANIKVMYPINDMFTPFLNLSIGGTVACSSTLNWHKYEILDSYYSSGKEIVTHDYDVTTKMHGGFYCDFGGGLRYKRLNISVGLLYQTMSLKEKSLAQKYENQKVYDTYKIDGGFVGKFSSFYMKVGVNF